LAQEACSIITINFLVAKYVHLLRMSTSSIISYNHSTFIDNLCAKFSSYLRGRLRSEWTGCRWDDSEAKVFSPCQAVELDVLVVDEFGSVDLDERETVDT
jgi:hypothetical protein